MSCDCFGFGSFLLLSLSFFSKILERDRLNSFEIHLNSRYVTLLSDSFLKFNVYLWKDEKWRERIGIHLNSLVFYFYAILVDDFF